MSELEKGEAYAGRTGTVVSFMPDAEIFDELEFDFDMLAQRMREMAFLTAGLRLTLVDEREGGKSESFFYEGGISDFVRHINAAKEPAHPNIISFRSASEEGDVEIAMQWNGELPASRCSRSRTTSTRTRAARTSPASGPRSRAR